MTDSARLGGSVGSVTNEGCHFAQAGSPDFFVGRDVSQLIGERVDDQLGSGDAEEVREHVGSFDEDSGALKSTRVFPAFITGM